MANHGRVFTSLLLATGDFDTARDATDEAFTRAVGSWDRVRAMESPTGWTYRVALNVVRRVHRRRSLEQRLLRRQVVEHVVPGPAGEAWDVVRELPPRQRTVVVLRHVAGLTQVEIADALGLSRSTVASTLDDAHRRLGRLLADGTDGD